MTKSWTYKYGEDTIVVENSWVDGEKLYVNGELHDHNRGVKANGSVVKGKLASGEEVKASLGGTVTIECSLFIDNKLQTPLEIKEEK